MSNYRQNRYNNNENIEESNVMNNDTTPNVVASHDEYREIKDRNRIREKKIRYEKFKKEQNYITHTNTTNSQEIRDVANSTVFIVLKIVVALMLIAIIRIAYIQYSERGDKWRAFIENKYIESKAIPAKRGRILSSDGKTLTQSTEIHKVSVDFFTIKDKDFTDKNVKIISKKMSELFPSTSVGDYAKKIVSYKVESDRRRKLGRKAYEKNIIPYNKDINSLQLEEIKALPIFGNSIFSGGVIVRTTIKREGIYGEMAKRVLGRMEDTLNPERKPFGIEDSFNAELSGTDGTVVMRRFSKDLWTPVGTESNIAIDGADVVTTIDTRIQYYAHTALRNAIVEHDAMRGTAIVIDVESGEIKAMANLGVSRNGEIRENYNYGAGMLMCIEPGSTLKLMSLLNFLDHTPAKLTDSLDAGKGYKYYYTRKTRISDTKRGGYGMVTLQEAFEKSSNIAFAEMMVRHMETQSEEYITMMEDRGIKKPFFLGINGEVAPYRDDAGVYVDKRTDALALSYGYGYKFTPLRTLMYYNAIANNGKMVAPRLIKEVVRGDEVVKRYETEVLNEMICKESTLGEAKKALEGVVLYGTGRNLYNDMFRIAGKTGTARIYKDGGYTSKRGTYYLGSFCGYFPADNPKYSCIVAIETFQPRGTYKTTYGGSLASPAFKEIATKVFRMGEKWTNTCRPPVRDMSRNLDDDKNYKNLKAEIIDYDIRTYKGGDEELNNYADMFDIDESIIKVGGEVPLNNYSQKGYDKNEVPDVKGMGLRDALYQLEERGLVVRVVGKGAVVRQSINKAQIIKKGQKITITLK